MKNFYTFGKICGASTLKKNDGMRGGKDSKYEHYELSKVKG